MNFEIEKGKPIPSDGHSTRVSKYPLEKMEVGDSFLVPAEKAISAKSRAYKYGRQSGKVFTTRLMTTGLRIWRRA